MTTPGPLPRRPAARRRRGAVVAALALTGLLGWAVPASATVRAEPPVARASALLAAPALAAPALTAPLTAPALAAVTALAPSGGTVTFGVRPAGEKNVDQRSLWDYKDQPPGRTFIDHVGVVNLSTQPVSLDVYPADAYNNLDGGVDVYTPATASKDLGSWITLAKTKVTVPARATVIMPFMVKIPANAQPGDHTAGIVASFLAPGKDAKGNAIQLNSRVGQRVYLRVRGPLQPAVALEGLSAGYRAGGPFGQGTSSIRFTVRNSGNVRVSGTPNVRVSGLFSDADVRSLPPMPELLPGNSVTLSGTAQGLFPLDRDSAEVRVEPKSAVSAADPQLSPVVQSVGFWAVSWPLAAVIIVLVAAASWLGVGWWRRRRSTSPRRPDEESNRDDNGDDDDDTGGPGAPDTVVVPQGHRLVDLRDLEGQGVEAGGTHAFRALDRGGAPVRRRAALRRYGAVLALVFAAMSAGAGTAHAEDSGTLTFLPAKGSALSPMYVVTSAPCPTPTIAFVGYVSGGNFPPESVAISLNTSIAVRRDRPFGIPLSNTLKMLAQNNGVQLTPGKYTITVQCTDLNTVTIYRTFTGSVTVGANLEVTATLPSTPPDSGIPLDVLATTYPQVKASLQAEAAGPSAGATPGATPGASGGAATGTAQGVAPGAAGAGPSGAPGGNGAVLGGPNEAASTSGSVAESGSGADAGGGSLLPVVLVGAGVIAALVILRWFSGRRQSAALAAVDDDRVDWSQLEDEFEVDLDEETDPDAPAADGDGEDAVDDDAQHTVDVGDRNDR